MAAELGVALGEDPADEPAEEPAAVVGCAADAAPAEDDAWLAEALELGEAEAPLAEEPLAAVGVGDGVTGAGLAAREAVFVAAAAAASAALGVPEARGVLRTARGFVVVLGCGRVVADPAVDEPSEVLGPLSTAAADCEN
ncbi:hypothetical protein [Gryllotalpicola ginsengisoli]|uniref:hypothetical protein n=1 Tax=Gryllotalpicola ginsengisoli TaxID=444608 RepID=UPI0012DF96F8|nr:hypothetical protein [Gryllotalpicola ginsengisoli]